MATIADIAEYVKGLGVTDYDKLFGGELGLLKPSGAPVDYLSRGFNNKDRYSFKGYEYGGSGDPFAHMPDFYKSELDKIAQQVGADILRQRDDSGQLSGIPYSLSYNDSTGGWDAPISVGFDNSGYAMQKTSPFQFEGFADKKNELDAKYSQIGNRWQITPELLNSTGTWWQKPNGSEGQWINNINSIKYDPQYGLYLDPIGGSLEGGYDVGGYTKSSGMLESILTDPIWLTTLSFGLGAALGPTAQAAGAAAPAGEAAAGAISAPLPGAAADFGWTAASGLTPSELAGTSGSWLGSLSDAFNQSGDWLQQNNPFKDLFSSPQSSGNLLQNAPQGDIYSMLGVENPGFFPQSTTNPGLFNQLGVTGEFGGMSYAPWAESLASGATPAQLSAWAPTGSSSMWDTAKAAYDKYVKPANQVRSAANMLDGGSGRGRTGIVQQGAQQEPDYGVAPTTYYPNTGLPNWGGMPQLPNVGGAPQGQNGTGFNIPGGMSGYFDYLPEYIKKGMIRR